MLACRVIVAFALTTTVVSPSMAWDGVNQETGAAVTIEQGNLVRSGQTIDVYDGESGEYKSFDVQDVRSAGSSVEVEVYDTETGETQTLEMDN